MAITKINTPELFDLGTTNSSLRLPSGDTASRPSNPNTGEWRYNTDDNYVEYWDGNAWFQIDYESTVVPCTTNTINYPTAITAYYKMEDATDQTGNYNGTPTNVNFNVAGKFGNAGEFNGSSSIMYVNGFDTTTNFSISLWFKTSASSNQVLANNGGSEGGKIGFLWQLNPSGKILLVTSSGGANFNGTPSSLSYNDGNWHNAVLNYASNGVYSIYVDNQSVVSETSSRYTGSAVASRPFAIGAWSQLNQYWFNGLIDQVRIFSSALTSDQVTQLYNEVQCAPTIVPSEHFNVNTYMGNGSTQTIDAKFNEAAVFNGSSSFITIPSIKSQLQSGASFTISCWVNVSSSQSGEAMIINTAASSSTQGVNIGIRPSTGLVYFQIRGNNNLNASGTTNLVGAGWKNIVLTHTTSSTILYVNGTQEASIGANTIGTIPNNLTLGKWASSSLYYLNGKIDQVRIFNTVLTPQQVTELYTDETTATAQLLDFPVGAGCIAAYELDGNADDISGLYSGTPTDIGYTGMQFAPDFVWIKDRDTAYQHQAYDSVRGVTKKILPSSTAQETTDSTGLTAFDSNGFTISTNVGINTNNNDYVAWCWKAAGYANTFNVLEGGTVTSDSTASGAGITAGSITTGWSVSANRDAGFSIVKYTANATSGATIGHGLDQELDLLIVKSTNLGQAWNVYVKDVTDTSSKYLKLNETSSIADLITVNPRFIPNNFTDSVFSVGNDNSTNGISGTDQYIAYCFHSVDGMSDIGSYVGTGAAGNNIVTGFRPAFVMVKSSSNAEPWFILDNKRDPNNPRDNRLMPDSDAAESDGSVHTMDFNSNGFTLNGTVGNGTNGSGVSYIFMAFAEEVFVPDNFFNDDSTVATYKLNGDAGDDSGNGYNGVASNVTYAAGKFDEAAVFNGSISEVDFPNLGLGGNTTRSVSLWVNPSVTPVSRGVIFSYGSGSNGQAFALDIDSSNNLRLSYYNRDYGTSTTVPNNTWTNIVITYNGGAVETASNTKIYINGASQTLSALGGTYTGVANTSDSNYGIGYRTYTDSLYFNGSIDQVRIFDRVLDSGEVDQLYNE